VLSLGSNLGDRMAWLNTACAALEKLPGVRLIGRSPIYETEPLGVPDAFAHHLFLNGVVIVESCLTPLVFSRLIHDIEDRLGRIRGGTPNQPRTIDIDIITFGDLVCASPALTVPHPRALERRFVLQPLADLRPDFIFPDSTQTVSELLRLLPVRPACHPVA